MTSIKPIPGFETTHSIDSNGVVYRNIDGELQPMKGSLSHHGFRKAHLTSGVNDKVIIVHRLVAALFIGECENDDYVVHINGDRLDNRVENLQYIPRNQLKTFIPTGSARKPTIKLTNKSVKSSKGSSKAKGFSQMDIALASRVPVSTTRDTLSSYDWADWD